MPAVDDVLFDGRGFLACTNRYSSREIGDIHMCSSTDLERAGP